MIGNEALDAFLELRDECYRLLSLYQAIQPRKAQKKVASVEAEDAEIPNLYLAQVTRTASALVETHICDVPDEAVDRLLHATLPDAVLQDIEAKLNA